MMGQRCLGVWAVVLDELGLDPVDAGGGRAVAPLCKAADRSWASSHRDDPDLAGDVRSMVPLFRGVGRDEFHVLAVLGDEQRGLRVGYAERPAVSCGTPEVGRSSRASPGAIRRTPWPTRSRPPAGRS